MRPVILFAILPLLSGPAAAQNTPAGEQPVEPYQITNENAAAEPYAHAQYFEAFGGKAGIDRLVADFAARIQTNPVIKDIFFAADWVRFRRTLAEQFCYILGGPCDYTGRPMKELHQQHGITEREFNALVVDLQKTMDENGIPFRIQNKLVAKLAPMADEIIGR